MTAGWHVLEMLSGLRVLDLSEGPTGALTAALLGDFGADVIKTVAKDPRTGRDTVDPDWLVGNRGKRLGLTGEDPDVTRDVVAELVRGCHVVIAETAELLARVGVTADSVGARVAVVLPPYDVSSTPWSGGESVEMLTAMTGLPAAQSSFSGEPVETVYPYLRYAHAAWAATCAVAALLERQRSGAGQLVSVSGLQAAALYCGYLYARPDYVADVVRTGGSGGQHPVYRPYRGSDDRWFLVGGLGPKFARAVLVLTGSQDLLDDDRVGGKLDRIWAPDNSGWVIEHLEKIFAGEPADHWIKLLEAADVPCTLLQAREQWFAGPQVAAGGQRQELTDPLLGPMVAAALPVFPEGRPPNVRAIPPASPLERIRWGATDSWRVPLSVEAAPPGTGPLAGVRVASMGSFVAGPFTGSLLAELGADVVKVEPPQGDPWRLVGFAYNRGTRGLAVDMHSSAGRQAVHRVLATCDLLLDNFRVGVTRRLGISHEQLQSLGTDVVTVSVTAYGESGPLAELPGYDVVAQAASGMMTALGGRNAPVMSSLPSIDHTTATLSAFAAVLGLLHRARAKKANHLSTSLVGTALYIQAPELLSYRGRPPGRSGGRDYQGPGALDRIYRVSDGFVRLQMESLDAPAWRKAGLAIDDQETAGGVAAAITATLARHTRQDALERLARAGVRVAPVRGVAEIVSDPELHGSGVLDWLPAAGGARFCVPGRLSTFSRTGQSNLLPAPGLGEHTAEVLAQAGYSRDEIALLVDSGDVASGEPMEVRYIPPYR